MYLATKAPSFTVEDARIVLEVPSGKDKVQIALTLNQLLHLHFAAQRVMSEAYDKQERHVAEVINLRERRA